MKRVFTVLAMLTGFNFSFGQTFTLKSADLGGQFTNEFVAGSFGCNGANRSPALSWQDAPGGTKSFAVTMYDMDARTGSGFWHWVVVDIPANVHGLKQGAGDIKSGTAPAGCLQSINDTGQAGYLGPCPDEGEQPHRYLMTVYALKSETLGTTAGSTAALTGFLLNKQALAKASLVVYLKR
jgi:Raf kinase inhibitor-like YbhB/YbcL family protein